MLIVYYPYHEIIIIIIFSFIDGHDLNIEGSDSLLNIYASFNK